MEMFKRLQRLKRCRGKQCYAAPKLSMTLKPASGCVPGALRVRMTGPATKYLSKVAFYAGGRRVGLARPVGTARVARPLQRVVRTLHVRAGRKFKLRAKATFDDGRLMTLDRTRRSCAAIAADRG